MQIKLTQVVEGDTKLLVPDLKKYKIPEHAPVFYNPAMKHDRDISVRLLKEYFGKKKVRVLDLLAGVGARGLRYAKENKFDVSLNDIQPSAFNLIKKNAKLNKVKVKVTNKEANQLLTELKYEKFDAIDLDPFGTPSPFLSNTFLALKPKDSIIAITATDLGALSGVYPEACFRKYSIVTGKTSFLHELGIRNLIMAAFREAAKQDYSLKPLYSYYNLHYYRIFCEMVGGKKRANRSKTDLGFISYCPKCERRDLIPLYEEIKTKCECREKRKVFGITWLGKIGDYDFLKEATLRGSTIAKSKYFGGYEEYGIAEPYYDLHRLSFIGKTDAKKTFNVIEKLRDMGYKAERTHFSGYGIKTRAPFEVLKKVLSKD